MVVALAVLVTVVSRGVHITLELKGGEIDVNDATTRTLSGSAGH
jgi:hypothetical protein